MRIGNKIKIIVTNKRQWIVTFAAAILFQDVKSHIIVNCRIPKCHNLTICKDIFNGLGCCISIEMFEFFFQTSSSVQIL